MTGDPRVLAPLQQAFNTSDNEHTRRAITSAWEHETDGWSVVMPTVDQRIRAWTPPSAEPSLDDFAFGLSIKFAELSVELDELKASLERLKNQQTLDCKHTGIALTDLDRRLTVQENKKPEQHPEPTAPDDPVCARCNGTGIRSWHPEPGITEQTECDECDAVMDGLPAPPPAPDLDPVPYIKAEIDQTVKVLFGKMDVWRQISRTQGATSSEVSAEEVLASLRHWMLFNGLKDGGA